MANFKPIKCLSSKLDSLSKVEGQFILTTDTKKLYYDNSSTSRIEIGSENGIKDITLDNINLTIKYDDNTTKVLELSDMYSSIITSNDLLNFPRYKVYNNHSMYQNAKNGYIINYKGNGVALQLEEYTKLFSMSTLMDGGIVIEFLESGSITFDWYVVSISNLDERGSLSAYINIKLNDTIIVDNITDDSASGTFSKDVVKGDKIIFGGKLWGGTSPTAGTIGIVMKSNYEPNYLATNIDYKTPYMPVYNGSPATKKYVDDSLSSQPIIPATLTNLNSQYQFVLGENGYFVNNNAKQGAHSSYVIGRVKFNAKNTGVIVLSYRSYGESSYDYGIFGQLDQALTTSNSDDGASNSTKVLLNCKGAASAAYKTITYNITTTGEHFFDIKYRKDSSTDSNDDSLQFQLMSSNVIGTIKMNSAIDTSSFVSTTGTQTISGTKTFSTIPKCSITPTADTHLVNKAYVDALIQEVLAKIPQGEFFAIEELSSSNPGGDKIKWSSSNSDGLYIYGYVSDTSTAANTESYVVVCELSSENNVIQLALGGFLSYEANTTSGYNLIWIHKVNGSIVGTQEVNQSYDITGDSNNHTIILTEGYLAIPDMNYDPIISGSSPSAYPGDILISKP